jgi:hypothetical protein
MRLDRAIEPRLQIGSLLGQLSEPFLFLAFKTFLFVLVSPKGWFDLTFR